MKQKDITTIAVIAIVSGVFAMVLSQVLVATPKNLQQEVEVVQKIDSNFNDDNDSLKKFINDKAINPTRLIQIGPNQQPNPFEER
jgi:hypothetical protein